MLNDLEELLARKEAEGARARGGRGFKCLEGTDAKRWAQAV